MVTIKIWLLVLVPHVLIFLLYFSAHVEFHLIDLLLSIVIIASLYYFLRLYLFKNLNRSIKSVSQDSLGNWHILDGKNQQQLVSILPSTFVNRYFIIVNYAGIDNRKYSVLFTPDSIDLEQFRRLKIRLK